MCIVFIKPRTIVQHIVADQALAGLQGGAEDIAGIRGQQGRQGVSRLPDKRVRRPFNTAGTCGVAHVQAAIFQH